MLCNGLQTIVFFLILILQHQVFVIQVILVQVALCFHIIHVCCNGFYLVVSQVVFVVHHIIRFILVILVAIFSSGILPGIEQGGPFSEANQKN